MPKRKIRFAAKRILPNILLGRAKVAERIEASSPYVTSDKLFSQGAAQEKALYTVFEAMNFISGASSLIILERLMESGVAVFHVDALHAKVVLIDRCYFSLGSQNLTKRGERNIEANVVAGDGVPSASVLQFFESLQTNAVQVTREDILAMRKLVEPFLDQYEQLSSEGNGIDEEILRLHIERESKERENQKRRRERARKRLVRMIRIRRELEVAAEKKGSHEGVVCRVKTLTNIQEDDLIGDFDTRTNSLVPTGNGDFIELLRGVRIQPKRLSRYLIIDQRTGKLAFARVGRGRITFFSSGVSFHEPFSYGDRNFDIVINFEWDGSGIRKRSGTVLLKDENSGREYKIEFAFHLNGLELFGHAFESLESEFLNLSGKVDSKPLFQAHMIDHLERVFSDPFRFKHKLHGTQASGFFKRRNIPDYWVVAHSFRDSAILIARPYP